MAAVSTSGLLRLIPSNGVGATARPTPPPHTLATQIPKQRRLSSPRQLQPDDSSKVSCIAGVSHVSAADGVSHDVTATSTLPSQPPAVSADASPTHITSLLWGECNVLQDKDAVSVIDGCSKQLPTVYTCDLKAVRTRKQARTRPPGGGGQFCYTRFSSVALDTTREWWDCTISHWCMQPNHNVACSSQINMVCMHSRNTSAPTTKVCCIESGLLTSWWADDGKQCCSFGAPSSVAGAVFRSRLSVYTGLVARRRRVRAGAWHPARQRHLQHALWPRRCQLRIGQHGSSTAVVGGCVGHAEVSQARQCALVARPAEHGVPE
eukprot:m.87104 g.87104  ORF g.87104 m.87104 type:complete len:321 (-) comp14896_c1_seq1:806-1768(-)